jgi:PhnB protein
MTDKSYVPSYSDVLTPYICPRECAAAIDWYAEVFGADEEGDRYLEPDGRVGHAAIRIDDAVLMLSDAFPDYGTVAPADGNSTTTYALNLYVPDADATVAAAEKAGASIQRPVEDQFYGARMGTLIDPFGIRWMVSTHVRDVSPEEMGKVAESYGDTGAEPGPLS